MTDQRTAPAPASPDEALGEVAWQTYRKNWDDYGLTREQLWVTIAAAVRAALEERVAAEVGEMERLRAALKHLITVFRWVPERGQWLAPYWAREDLFDDAKKALATPPTPPGGA